MNEYLQDLTPHEGENKCRGAYPLKITDSLLAFQITPIPLMTF